MRISDWSSDVCSSDLEQIQRGGVATLNILLKSDTTGSLEALTESLQKLERDEVKLAFVHRAVGGITQQDVQLAATAGATIIGFNARPDRKARTMAESEEVEVRTHEILHPIPQALESRSDARTVGKKCSRTSRAPWT